MCIRDSDNTRCLIRVTYDSENNYSVIAWIKSNGKGVLKTATVNSGTGDITFSSEFEWADTPSESEVEPLGDFDIVNYDVVIDYGVASTEKIVIVFQGDNREPKGVVVTESGGSFTKSTEEDMFAVSYTHLTLPTKRIV